MKISWIRAGAYAFNARSIHYINTAAKWLGEPADEVPRDAWGEFSPNDMVEYTGVEVVFLFGHDDPPKLQFPDGSPEAEDLRRFVEAAGLPRSPA